MRLRKTKSRLIILFFLIFIVFINEAAGQIHQRRLGNTRKNEFGGYDFYNESKQKTGYSMSNRRGGYDYYDARGNKIGTLKKDPNSKGSYTYYNAEGIGKGQMQRRTGGTYYYKDKNSGKIVDSVPEKRGKIGSIPPETFSGTGE